MNKYYITFGQIHAHSYNGKTLDKDTVGVIEAKDLSSAREFAFANFSDKFFTVYTEQPEMKFYKELVELNFSTETGKFIETDYDTVLDRIFIRYKIPGKEVLDTYSLKQMLGYQDGLWDWLVKFSQNHIENTTPDIPLTEEELINIVKWLDENGAPPTRLKSNK